MTGGVTIISGGDVTLASGSGFTIDSASSSSGTGALIIDSSGIVLQGTGSISGFTSLSKSGSGELVITDASISSTITVGEGTAHLVLPASLESSGVNVNSGATLRGTASVGGVTCFGTLYPGSSYGSGTATTAFTMTSLTLSTGSTLIIDLVADSSGTVTGNTISVSGAVTLGGTLIVNVQGTPGTGFIDVITGGSSVTGDFSQPLQVTGATAVTYSVMTNGVRVSFGSAAGTSTTGSGGVTSTGSGASSTTGNNGGGGATSASSTLTPLFWF